MVALPEKGDEPLLKVGDKIAVNNRFYGIQIVTIDKVTPTMYVAGHSRFRHDLKIVGPDRFGPFSGRVATPEDLLKVRIQNATERLRKFIVTGDNIDAVEELLIARARENGA